ncbi:MAG: TetR/AcrR family transcriptional regulator [Desulfosarcinaceae bacterium]|nr:TetR/AcrR family transcriptional regulator [Desulfosarcinaceae bacterium]
MKRDRASDGKAELILNAAIAVFAEYGYHKAKMAKIAEVAGVSAGSIYLYYKNKASLLSHIFEMTWEMMIAITSDLTRRRDLTPPEKLDLMVDQHFDLFHLETELARVLVNEHYTWCQLAEARFNACLERYFADIDSLLGEGQRTGIFNPHIAAVTFRHVLFGGMRRLLEVWAGSPDALPIGRIRQDFKVLLKRGVLLP